jgi:hypothetical protein
MWPPYKCRIKGIWKRSRSGEYIPSLISSYGFVTSAASLCIRTLMIITKVFTHIVGRKKEKSGHNVSMQTHGRKSSILWDTGSSQSFGCYLLPAGILLVKFFDPAILKTEAIFLRNVGRISTDCKARLNREPEYVGLAVALVYYSGDALFVSRPWYLVFWIKLVVVFLSLSRQIQRPYTD